MKRPSVVSRRVSMPRPAGRRQRWAERTTQCTQIRRLLLQHRQFLLQRGMGVRCRLYTQWAYPPASYGSFGGNRWGGNPLAAVNPQLATPYHRQQLRCRRARVMGQAVLRQEQVRSRSRNRLLLEAIGGRRRWVWCGWCFRKWGRRGYQPGTEDIIGSNLAVMRVSARRYLCKRCPAANQYKRECSGVPSKQ